MAGSLSNRGSLGHEIGSIVTSIAGTQHDDNMRSRAIRRHLPSAGDLLVMEPKAVKIQARFRGAHVRRHLSSSLAGLGGLGGGGGKGRSPEEYVAAAKAAEVKAAEARLAAEAKAAAALQARVRGKQARKDRRLRCSSAAPATAAATVFF